MSHQDLPVLSPGDSGCLTDDHRGFLSGLHHEIRTPLSGILGMTDLLLETTLNPEQLEYVRLTRRSAETLFDLVNETLEYLSVTAGAVELEEGDFDLTDFVRTLRDECAIRFGTRGAAVLCYAGEESPELVRGDPYRLRQVCMLLVNLSLRLARDPQVEIFRLSPSPADPVHLALAVLEQELALNDAERQELLNPLGAGRERFTRRWSGLGFAVPLISRLAGILGGAFRVENSGASGTRLSLTVPLRRAEVAAAAPLVEEPHVRGSAHTGGRLLLAEDNRISQRVITHFLSKAAWACDCVSDGAAAVEAVRRHDYRLVIMDLQMPHMDGLEATRHIRLLPGHEHTPVVALTATSSDDIRRECRHAGVSAFLTKPVQAWELLDTIERCLAAAEQGAALAIY